MPVTVGQRRVPKGASDRVELEDCICIQNKRLPRDAECKWTYLDGRVLLFYVYKRVPNPMQLAEELHQLCLECQLTGKIRVSEEGINVTVAGDTEESTQTFINTLSQHDMLSHLDLSSPEKRHDFFKPSPGCSHVFDGLSIKLVEEICPFGQRGWQPKTMRHLPHSNTITALKPSEFHQELSDAIHSEDTLILDVRNYYESRVGFFEKAICPPIRRFSALPDFVQHHPQIFQGKKKVLSYCTGGIRCEKAAAWLQETLEVPVIMLEGGIHNYLEWTRSQPKQSLFKGVNYVFDARVAMGVQDHQIVAKCQFCGCLDEHYYKCQGKGCHLMVICCQACKNPDGIYCCQDCKSKQECSKRSLCVCEVNRKQQLEQFHA